MSPECSIALSHAPVFARGYAEARPSSPEATPRHARLRPRLRRGTPVSAPGFAEARRRKGAKLERFGGRSLYVTYRSFRVFSCVWWAKKGSGLGSTTDNHGTSRKCQPLSVSVRFRAFSVVKSISSSLWAIRKAAAKRRQPSHVGSRDQEHHQIL